MRRRFGRDRVDGSGACRSKTSAGIRVRAGPCGSRRPCCRVLGLSTLRRQDLALAALAFGALGAFFWVRWSEDCPTQAFRISAKLVRFGRSDSGPGFAVSACSVSFRFRCGSGLGVGANPFKRRLRRGGVVGTSTGPLLSLRPLVTDAVGRSSGGAVLLLGATRSALSGAAGNTHSSPACSTPRDVGAPSPLLAVSSSVARWISEHPGGDFASDASVASASATGSVDASAASGSAPLARECCAVDCQKGERRKTSDNRDAMPDMPSSYSTRQSLEETTGIPPEHFTAE